MGSDYSQSPEQLLIYSEVPTHCMPDYTTQGQDEVPKKTANTQAARKIFQYFSWNSPLLPTKIRNVSHSLGISTRKRKKWREHTTFSYAENKQNLCRGFVALAYTGPWALTHNPYFKSLCLPVLGFKCQVPQISQHSSIDFCGSSSTQTCQLPYNKYSLLKSVTKSIVF